MGDQVNRLPVEFLREGRIQIVGAQPRLHMAHGDLQIKTGQRRHKGGGGVAMHQHHIGLFVFQYFLDPDENVDGHIEQGLIFLHDAQIVLGLHVEAFQNLIQHLPVLTRNADNRFQFGMLAHLQHQRTHFDGFGPGAEDQHDFLHERTSFSPSGADLLSFAQSSNIVCIRCKTDGSSLEERKVTRPGSCRFESSPSSSSRRRS